VINRKERSIRKEKKRKEKKRKHGEQRKEDTASKLLEDETAR
jgi:hypothetical protein